MTGELLPDLDVLADRLEWLGVTEAGLRAREERSEPVRPPTARTLCTVELTFPRSVTAEQVVAFWSGVAAALTVGHTLTRRPFVVVEVSAGSGRLRHFIHTQERLRAVVQQQLASQLSGVRWQVAEPPELIVDEAIELRLSSQERVLRLDRASEVSAAVLAAVAAVTGDERAVLQWVLAGAAPMKVVHRESPGVTAGDRSDVRQALGDRATEAKQKAVEPVLVGVCRLGVAAGSVERRRLLIRQMLGALRGSDAPGVRTLPRPLPGTWMRSRILRRQVPRLFPATYNGAELAARAGFPIDGPQVPGLTLGGSRLLVPAHDICTDIGAGAMVARSTFPGLDLPLVIRDEDRRQHLHVIGPTGTGKSTLMCRLALADIKRGHGTIVIDPRGDLVDDVLDRLPPERVQDVIVLDPADEEGRVVGYNPMAVDGRSLDLMADGITTVFAGLFAQYWGPRTDDILRSSILTLGLAERPSSSAFTLCEVPPLLTDKAFRTTLTAGLNDPIALDPFWAVYNGMRDGDRSTAISPLLNKLRAFLLRKSLRAMLGQSQPGWSIEEVMAERKILLVPLRAGQIGEEAARLLGSLVIARIWHAALGRSGIDRAERHPVHVHIDEFQTLVHLPTSLGDLLAQARGLGIGLTLAHQHFGQLSPELRRDVLANARSRVIFQQGIEDARLLAKGLPELEPEDLQGLPSREVVLSFAVDAEVQPAVTGRTLPLDPPTGTAKAAREHSRMTYGVDSQAVEAALRERRITRGSAGRKSGNKVVSQPPRLQIGELPDEEAS